MPIKSSLSILLGFHRCIVCHRQRNVDFRFGDSAAVCKVWSVGLSPDKVRDIALLSTVITRVGLAAMSVASANEARGVVRIRFSMVLFPFCTLAFSRPPTVLSN